MEEALGIEAKRKKNQTLSIMKRNKLIGGYGGPGGTH
jgi:hypothetical protein